MAANTYGQRSPTCESRRKNTSDTAGTEIRSVGRRRSWTSALCLLAITLNMSAIADQSTPGEQSESEKKQQEHSSNTPRSQASTRKANLMADRETSAPNKTPGGLAAFDTRRRTDQTPQWIDGYDPEYFTLQIISVGNEESAKRLLESIAVLGRDKGYVGYEIEGATRYGAFIGVYRRYSDAERALQQLPPHIQEYKPWIRKVKDVQRQALP